MPVYGIYGPLGVLDSKIETDTARLLAAVQRIEIILQEKIELAQKQEENRKKLEELNAEYR